MDSDGYEQAQWILIDGLKFCVLLVKDIAFIEHKEVYTIARPSTGDQAKTVLNTACL